MQRRGNIIDMSTLRHSDKIAGSGRQLDLRIRASLDVARASAAVYVVLHHTVSLPSPFSALLSFGQEAVLIFFLLSGFVIFANENNWVQHPKRFYMRRLRRIYPPMIAAMLISTVLWIFGLISAKPSLKSFLGTIFALQDISSLKPGVFTDPWLGNNPLWSLSYEIFFYAVFPLVMIGWRRSATVTRWSVSLASMIAMSTYFFIPNHLSLVLGYFGIWWAGAVAADLFMSNSIGFRSAVPEIAGLSGLVLVALCGTLEYGYHGLGIFPFLIARHCLVVLFLFLVIMSPLRHLLANVSVRLAQPAAVVAGVSYGLYVVHYPVLVQTGANSSWLFIPTALLTVFLAWVVDKWVPSLFPRVRRS